MSRQILSRSIVYLVIALILSGCTRNLQHRTDVEQPCRTDRVEAKCENSSLEEHTDYLLGFVEFDDQGWFWDHRQLDVLEERLLTRELDRGLLMVVFIHGWKHTAAFDDPNVVSFRDTLRKVCALEQQVAQDEARLPRRVVGIYAGWRGLSLDAPLLKELTFWDRKATAEKIGHSAVTEFLTRIESVKHLRQKVHETELPAKTKLVVVGHSFGGAVVYSALSQLFIERFIDRKGEGKPPETFGDLVILVNPAFEASRFTPLQQLADRRSYLTGQLPLMAILTSTGDGATGTAFPIGRWFSTRFESYRDGIQKTADRKAVGHFPPYLTHTLKRTAKVDEESVPAEPPVPEAESPSRSLSTVKTLRRQWREEPPASGWELSFSGMRLAHLTKATHPLQRESHPLNPLLVVAVDNDIIKGHSGIFSPDLVLFLREFIAFATGGAR